MKVAVMKRIEQITADFNPATLLLEEDANLELIATNKRDLKRACKEFGYIIVQEVTSYTSGEGLERATVGEQAIVMITTSIDSGEYAQYQLETNITAELVHCKSKVKIQCGVQELKGSRYKITYQPTKRGKHQLKIKINGREIQDSPFTIAVTSSPKSLGRPVRVIGNLKEPYFVTTNSQNQIIVAESALDCIFVFSPEGKKIHTFGSRGTNDGQLKYPRGVAVDSVDNIYVADRDNHRIQKLSPEGQFVKSVGIHSSGHLHFTYPLGISYNPSINKLYVCDHNNHRVQVLNADLTFHSTIGREGTGNGEFKYVKDIAFNSKGDIYVTDYDNHRVQIFNQDGTFIGTISKKKQQESLQCPYGVAVDSDDTVYVSERYKCCISVFSAKGEYLTSFGSRGKAEGQLCCPCALHIDKNDSILVCDKDNGRIQIF